MATYESDPKRSPYARSETARRQAVRVERYGRRHGLGQDAPRTREVGF